MKIEELSASENFKQVLKEEIIKRYGKDVTIERDKTTLRWTGTGFKDENSKDEYYKISNSNDALIIHYDTITSDFSYGETFSVLEDYYYKAHEKDYKMDLKNIIEIFENTNINNKGLDDVIKKITDLNNEFNLVINTITEFKNDDFIDVYTEKLVKDKNLIPVINEAIDSIKENTSLLNILKNNKKIKELEDFKCLMINYKKTHGWNTLEDELEESTKKSELVLLIQEHLKAETEEERIKIETKIKNEGYSNKEISDVKNEVLNNLSFETKQNDLTK